MSKTTLSNRLGPYTILMNETQRDLITQGILNLINDGTRSDNLETREELGLLYSMFSDLPKEFTEEQCARGHRSAVNMLHGFCL